MRALLLLTAACAVSPTPTYFEGHATGTVDGRAVELSFHLDDDGATGLQPAGAGFTVDAANGFMDAWSDTKPRITVALPPQLFGAGVRTVPIALKIDDTLTVATDGTKSIGLLDFADARFLGEASERVLVRGDWTAQFYFPRGELHFTRGRFQLVARCGPSQDVRICGQPGPPRAAPPFSYDDCPAALTEAPDYVCANGLCASDRYRIPAEGCLWHRFALTDEARAQLTIAGWAEPGCTRPVTTCNAAY